MKLAVLGTGYVGLVTGACLADFGHSVTCVDTDVSRLAEIAQGRVPFYEPGLEELVQRHIKSGRLKMSLEAPLVAAMADVIFLAVGTPSSENGEADLSQVLAAVDSLVPHLRPGVLLVTKSTVPVGTGALIEQRVRERAPALAGHVDVVSNPEFLREGSAISDFMRPDRVVIGARNERAAGVMREIYRPLYLIETPLIFTTVETSEMIKYASNAFLAVKISFINEVANLCDATGADVHVVAKSMGLDRRIGPKFLHPGPGYGGSCFPKDTRALVSMGARHGMGMEIVSAAIRVNDRQRQLVVQRIAYAAGGLDGRNVALLGLAFKPNTSDIRESPAWDICLALEAAGARVRAFDPAAMGEAARLLPPSAQISFVSDAYEAAVDADVLVVATEWNEFRALDLARLRTVMRHPAIVDTRNVLEPERVRAEGFAYVSIGRGAFGVSAPVRSVPGVRV